MADAAFQYAVVRVVPDVARGERINAGVVLFARERDFLAMRVHLDPARLRALAPEADADLIAGRLAGLERIAAGDPGAGPVAHLPRHERFHWLTAPSSTVLQPSEIHTGLCADPAAALDALAARLLA